MIQGCSSVAEVSSAEVFTTGCKAMDYMVGCMETDCTMVSTEMVCMVTGSMETDCTETVFTVKYMGLEEVYEDMER